MRTQQSWTADHFRIWTTWQSRTRATSTHNELALWSRCVAIYQQLRALPRRVRRAWQRQWAQSLAGVALLLALGQGQGWAATITVDGTLCTLVDALTAANSDTITGGCTAGSGADTLMFGASSTHTLTTAIPSAYGDNGLPLVTTTITIEGNGSTIERGAGAPDFRLLAVSTIGNLTLQNLTLTGGRAFGGGSLAGNFGGAVSNRGIVALMNSTVSDNAATFCGGGIDNRSGTLTLSNSMVSGNTAIGVHGGGIYNFHDGVVTVTNSTISNNTAASTGGAVYNAQNFMRSVTVVTLINSTVSGNSAGRGGGVFNGGGDSTTTLMNSTVSGNRASHGGGGIFNGGPLIVTNSTISGNTTSPYNSNGGGVYNGFTLTVSNSTISGNMAAGNGGGVFNVGFTLAVSNSTISGNMAAGDGGGVFNRYALTLSRSLVSGNASSTGAEIHDFSGAFDSSTVTVNNSNLFGHDGLTNAQAFSGFAPGATDLTATSDGSDPTALTDILDTTLQNNDGPTQTHALVSGSPAIDASPADADCQPTDQRGVTRPQGAACDIGAFESAPLNHFLCYKTKSSTGNTCADGSPMNEGMACEEEAQCGGTEDVTAFCLPNKFPKGEHATLTDQFETGLVDVQKPVSLCNPANKNGGDPTAPTDPDHLQAFQIKESKGQPKHEKRTNVLVENQFGTLRIDTLKPSRLLVPTAKSESGPIAEPTPGIDHFKCYTVKVTPQTPKFEKRAVSIVDQFNQPKDYDVVKPTRLCNPVDKDGESPGAETHPEHLMCYQVKPAKGELKHGKVPNIHVNNQFGPERLDTLKEEELCVPSSKMEP